MSRYVSAESSIFKIFGSEVWQEQDIKTFPENFTGEAINNEYIQVSVVPSGPSLNLNSASGVLMVSIFVESGLGPNRGKNIADALDSFLVGKTVPVVAGQVVQFNNSTMVPSGIDRDNPKLFRYNYTIPFSLFGVY